MTRKASRLEQKLEGIVEKKTKSAGKAVAKLEENLDAFLQGREKLVSERCKRSLDDLNRTNRGWRFTIPLGSWGNRRIGRCERTAEAFTSSLGRKESPYQEPHRDDSSKAQGGIQTRRRKRRRKAPRRKSRRLCQSRRLFALPMLCLIVVAVYGCRVHIVHNTE